MIANPNELFLRAARRGDGRNCFSLLDDGARNSWLPQLEEPINDEWPEGIPKRLLQFWHEPATMPDDVAAQVEEIQAVNPDLSCSLTGAEEARSFIHQYFGDETRSLFDLCFHPAMQSDVWRMCALYALGGIYSDVDIKPLGPLTRVVGGTKFSCALPYTLGSPSCVDNEPIITQPQHPVILSILETLLDNLRRWRKGGGFENIWVETGPGAATVGSMRWFAANCIVDDTILTDSGIKFFEQKRIGLARHHVQMSFKGRPESDWRLASIPKLG